MVSGKGYRECKSPEVGWPFSYSTNSEEARVPRVNEEKGEEVREIVMGYII